VRLTGRVYRKPHERRPATGNKSVFYFDEHVAKKLNEKNSCTTGVGGGGRGVSAESYFIVSQTYSNPINCVVLYHVTVFKFE